MRLVRADRPADPPVESAAAHGDLGEPHTLLAELYAAEPARRRTAARHLATYPHAASALCARLAVEPAASVRSVIFTVLIGLCSEDAVRGLLPCLRSEDAALRNAAIEALRHMPDVLEPHIRSLLEDNDSDVRIFAVNVLGALAHAQAPRWLEAVVRCDPHVNVCAAAVEGLAELGEQASRSVLGELPGRFPEEPFIAFAVKAALARIGTV